MMRKGCGYLMIDHRATGRDVNSDGKLQEYDCVHCVHCQKVIKILIKGAGVHEYETKFSCVNCKRPICKLCAQAMSETKECPGEFIRQVEVYRKTGVLPESMRRKAVAT